MKKVLLLLTICIGFQVPITAQENPEMVQKMVADCSSGMQYVGKVGITQALIAGTIAAAGIFTYLMCKNGNKSTLQITKAGLKGLLAGGIVSAVGLLFSPLGALVYAEKALINLAEVPFKELEQKPYFTKLINATLAMDNAEKTLEKSQAIWPVTLFEEGLRQKLSNLVGAWIYICRY